MRRRGCLFGISGSFILLLVCCGLLYFVGLPEFQNRLRDELGNELSTQVANQFEGQLPSGVGLEPGEYRIGLDTLEQRITSGLGQGTVDDFSITATGGELVITLGSGGQSLEYRGTPTVNSSGELEINDMSSNGGVAYYILPPDKLAGAVELGVNNYLATEGLYLQGVQVDGDAMILQIAE